MFLNRKFTETEQIVRQILQTHWYSRLSTFLRYFSDPLKYKLFYHITIISQENFFTSRYTSLKTAKIELRQGFQIWIKEVHKIRLNFTNIFIFKGTLLCSKTKKLGDLHIYNNKRPSGTLSEKPSWQNTLLES